MTLRQRPRAVLIGGTSHAGKSTLAADLAAQFGCDQQSTDRMARHPGRPWLPPGLPLPPHVRAHYQDNEVEALIDSVLAHYASLEALIGQTIEEARDGR